MAKKKVIRAARLKVLRLYENQRILSFHLVEYRKFMPENILYFKIVRLKL